MQNKQKIYKPGKYAWPCYTDEIEYIYTANGTKIAKEVAQSSATNTRYYIGNIEYNGSTPDIMHFEEGYVDLATNTYHYYLKDHLGNTRIVFKMNGGDAQVVQKNDYYPFGMDMYSWHSGTENKYKYNGKELQNEALDGISLALYDYHARYYDPALGRFHTVDPLAEWDFKTSPYAYVGNNPMNYIDPDGMRRTKEERLRDKEERRANRQAKRMAKKNNTKTIDAVSVVAKDGSKKSRKRRGGGDNRYVSNQPGFQMFGGAKNSKESTATETTGNIWATGDAMAFLEAIGAINKPLTRPPLALPSPEEHYVKTITTDTDIKQTSDKEIVEKSTGEGPKPDEMVKVKVKKIGEPGTENSYAIFIDSIDDNNYHNGAVYRKSRFIIKETGDTATTNSGQRKIKEGRY